MKLSTKCLLAVIATSLPFMAVAYDSNLGPCSYPSNIYHYGDTAPDGGIVFKVTGDGCHGMEAATSNAGSGAKLTWEQAVIAAASYNETDITTALTCSTTEAHTTPLCWHLPSKHELQLLHEQSDLVEGYTNGYYWSSTEAHNKSAWNMKFPHGAHSYSSIKNKYYARAIRFF